MSINKGAQIEVPNYLNYWLYCQEETLILSVDLAKVQRKAIRETKGKVKKRKLKDRLIELNYSIQIYEVNINSMCSLFNIDRKDNYDTFKDRY